jgi:hypothetical protein
VAVPVVDPCTVTIPGIGHLHHLSSVSAVRNVIQRYGGKKF